MARRSRSRRIALKAATLARYGAGALVASPSSPRLRRRPATVCRLIGATAFALVSLGGAPAYAQTPPAIVAPRIVEDPGAEYPQRALDDKVTETVTVTLLLEIDHEGVVQRATPETPAGHGFDEVAVAAALKLKLEPATKNGVPMAARIKHRYVFAPPPGQIQGKLTSKGTDKPLAGAKVTATAAGVTHTALTDANGAFVLAELPAGSYEIRVEASGFLPLTSTEQVDPGTETRAALRLARDESTALGGPPPKPPVDEEPIEEVTVRGTRPAREVTKRTLEQRELSRIPGTNGDALRALQNLPGVARPPAIAGLLIVRGAAPNETNYFVDGTLVPLVYHFGGLSSVVPTEMISRIDFYPGNFSAQYGRVTGAIVDVGLKDPNTKKLRGMAQVDLIDARVMVEGPIGKGWSFAVSGRRSWLDSWLGPALNALGAGVTTAPVYYDYQAMLHKRIDAKQSVRFTFFGGDDRLKVVVKNPFGGEPAAAGSIGLGTAFYRFQARYENRASDDTQFRATAAVGKDAFEFVLGANNLTLDSYPLSFRGEVTHKIAAGVKTNFGVDLLYTPYEISIRLPPLPRPGDPPAGPFGNQEKLTVDESGSQFRPGVYQELELTPWKGARIVPGVRLDYAKDTQKWDLSPRFVMRQDVTQSPRRTTIKGGIGVFRQPPQPQETAPLFGMQGLSSNRATHYSLGVERELTKQIDVSVEGFYRDLDNLVVQGRGNTGSGYSFGAETLIRYKPDDKFFGWIAYTLSRSVRRDADGEPDRLFGFDQTHILTALGSYRLGRGWEIGARYRLVSGSMSTPQQYGFYDQNAGAYLPLSYPQNGERLPLFHQLDVRVDKTWQFKYWKLGVYFDVWNVYNASNVEGVSYNFNSSQRVYGSSLPILPSLGIRGEL